MQWTLQAGGLWQDRSNWEDKGMKLNHRSSVTSPHLQRVGFIVTRLYVFDSLSLNSQWHIFNIYFSLWQPGKLRPQGKLRRAGQWTVLRISKRSNLLCLMLWVFVLVKTRTTVSIMAMVIFNPIGFSLLLFSDTFAFTNPLLSQWVCGWLFVCLCEERVTGGVCVSASQCVLEVCVCQHRICCRLTVL